MLFNIIRALLELELKYNLLIYSALADLRVTSLLVLSSSNQSYLRFLPV